MKEKSNCKLSYCHKQINKTNIIQSMLGITRERERKKKRNILFSRLSVLFQSEITSPRFPVLEGNDFDVSRNSPHFSSIRLKRYEVILRNAVNQIKEEFERERAGCQG